MTIQKYKLKRDVTVEECNWLDRDFREGEIVYDYPYCTYGCVSPMGVACTEKESETPFFELPKNSIEEV